jgi:hypothetical protein
MNEPADDSGTDSDSATTSMAPTAEEVAFQAAERARAALQQLEAVAREADSIELLATLSRLHLTQTAGEEPDVDVFARWQAKIEFLTWLAASEPLSIAKLRPVDGALIRRVEELLEEYFNGESLALAMSAGDADPEVRSLQRMLLMEAMHIRGEGTPEMVRFLAHGMYSGHDEWFRANLGFTCDEAFEIAEVIFGLLADRLMNAHEGAHTAAGRAEAERKTATKRAPESRSPEGTALVNAVQGHVLEAATGRIGDAETFSGICETSGLTAEQLTSAMPNALREKVAAFLRFFSREFGTLPGAPSPIDFNPLVQTPILVDRGQYFLFVPPLLWEATLNAPHYALMADAQYRPIYDKARADWLEQQVTEAFRRLWPDAQIGWSLTYGPKGQRSELDGLVLRGRKVILIECKWKSLTLLARRGDSDVLRRDIAQSIVKAFEQGRRARDYVRTASIAEFAASDGTSLRVDSRVVNEIVIISVLGRGALSMIAANPLEARVLGIFDDGELPWALSLFDLLAVCRTMEFGGQLFDYARRRAAVIADGRFHLHDEWDLLEFYFAGALDPNDPEFADKHMVTFTGSGRELEELVLNPSATVPENLRRRIHPKVRRLLGKLDRLPDVEATDAVAFLLGLSDRQLQQMGEYWIQVEEKTRADGKFHSVSGLPTPGGGGFTIICGRGTRDEFERLQFLVLLNKYKHHAPIWLGIGALPDGEEDPFAVSLDSRPWVLDRELDRLLPLWPVPGSTTEHS